MHEDTDRAKTLFLAALELTSDAERRAYLDAECAGDADLRRHVEGLLAAHGATGNPLDRPPAVVRAAADRLTDAGPAEPSAGERIGPYTLLQKLGEGGMGTVWAAEQHVPVRRRVALKLIKPGMDSRQVLRRFEAERQALALMDHTNIAKVFDAGTASDGRPYFAMELVKGVPITRYCDDLNLSVRERLELFIPVCQAIQHAHQKGVIHRDIKPSNVLVAIQDGRPVPNVIDFGVAKALHQQLAERTMYTEIGAVIGTLEYMAPEQAELSTLDVDTRADVYALGALLYELLTGSTPLDRKRLASAGLAEVMRIIREEEPVRPSNRLSGSHETLPGLAVHRRTEAARLTKEVRGDLDWIVMKCLEKDRTRRYETANGLARDLERHMADEPVEARPPGSVYRLRKFARRNRGLLAAVALVAVALVGGAAAATWQAVRATKAEALADKRYTNERRARNEADAATAKATAAERTAVSEAHKSEQVAAFMKRMLAGVGPSAAMGRDTTMLREILDDTTGRLGQLKDQPAVEADLRMVLGEVYYDIGDFEAAEAMSHAALDLRRQLLGNRHVAVASARSAYGEAVRKQGRYDEAERLLAEALAMQRELLGEDDSAVGLTLFRLGMVHNRRRDGARAEGVLRETLAISRRHPNIDTTGVSTAAVLDQLGLSLNLQSRHAEAESVFREALAIQRQHAPAGSPGLAHVLYNLSGPLRDQGKLAEAESCHREALEVRLRQLPPDHVDTLSSKYALTSCLIKGGQADEAVALIDDFAPRAEGKAGLQDQIPWLIGFRLRHFQKARDVDGCRTSAEMWERRNRSDPAFFFDAARYRAVTAAVLRLKERSPEAGASVNQEAGRAMDWLRKAVAAGFADVARLKQDGDLGVLRDREDFKALVAELEPKPEQVLASTREAVRLKPEDPAAHVGLGRALGGQGKSDEAAAAFREAIRLDPDFPEAYEGLGGVLRTQRKWDEARALDLRRLEIQIRLANNAVSERPDDANAYRDRGVFLCRAGRFREAIPDLDRAVELDPGDLWKYFFAAPVHLYLGDVGSYRRVSGEMARRFQGTNLPETSSKVVKASLIEPNPQGDLDLFARLILPVVALGEANRNVDWFKIDLGLVEYRRGRYDEAVKTLEGLPERGRFGASGRGLAGLVLAMAHAKAGRAEQALEALNEAVAIIDALKWTPGECDLGAGFYDWCIYQVILREARSELSGVISERQEAYLLLRRARVRADESAHAGRWAEAAAALEESIEGTAGAFAEHEYQQWYRAAAAWALAGNRRAYEGLCRRMLDRYRGSSDLQAAQLAARGSLLLPDTSYQEEAVRLAERTVTAAGAPAYNLLTRSLAEHRAGRHRQAIEWNDTALARADVGVSRRAAHQLVQAMALSRLGRDDEARAALSDALKATPAVTLTLSSDPIWEVLRREAIALMPAEAERPSGSSE